MIDDSRIEATRQRLQAMQGKDNPQTAIRKLRRDIETKLADGLTYKDIGPEIHAGLGLDDFGIKPENAWRVIAAALRHPDKITTKGRQARPGRKRKADQNPGEYLPGLFPEADPGPTSSEV